MSVESDHALQEGKIPDDVIYRSDPEIVQQVLASDEEYRGIVNDMAMEKVQEILEKVTPEEPSTEEAGELLDTDSGVQADGGAAGEISPEDLEVFRKYGFLDDDGKFLGKFKTPQDILKSFEHKEKLISKRLEQHPQELAEYLREHPEVVREIVGEEKPIEMPSLDEKRKIVEEWVDQQLGTRQDYLLNKFGAELEEEGIRFPENEKEWKALADTYPGLYARMSSELVRYDLARERLLQGGFQAIRYVDERIDGETRNAVSVLTTDTHELTTKWGLEPEDVVFLGEELEKHVGDPRFFEDDMGTGVYYLRPGALADFAAIYYPELLRQRVAQYAMRIAGTDEAPGGNGAGEVGGDVEYYARRRSSASRPVPSMAGTGATRSITGPWHPTPTPEQYKDPFWRDANMRDPQTRDAIAAWVASLPPEVRAEYYR